MGKGTVKVKLSFGASIRMQLMVSFSLTFEAFEPPNPWRNERTNMDVSENRGTPKSSILIGFSTINHPF